jgi:putative two-component system response regulator
MGLNEETVEIILYAAPMHDVGKIGIPDHILLKPGKLDPDEWQIMKQHTIIGAQILQGSDAEFIKLAEAVALTHHEKWDGSGYPNGLSGSKIPLAGRITAIADVFDALTSKRPYKEPFSLEKSFDIIKQSRGSHFDPEVADAFFAVEDEILTIKEKYKDEHESQLVRMLAHVS